MTFYILYKNPSGRKCKLEVEAENQGDAIDNFMDLFPQFTIFHAIAIPEWK